MRDEGERRFWPRHFRSSGNVFRTGDGGKACRDAAGAWPDHARNKKKARQIGGLRNKVLAPFYFPTQEYAVSSTMESLTAEFGMGSGVPSPPGAPRQISINV